MFRIFFATHLLKNGTDLRYIQQLLGHTRVAEQPKFIHMFAQKVFKK